MRNYQTFLDGMALGFFLGFLAFYLFYRFKASRPRKPKSEIDHLVDDIHRYYRRVSEGKREDME
jgi:hypothetical protein